MGTALGAECTVIEALPKLMPAFDREIAKTAERLLLTNRGVDYRTNVFASKVTPGKIGEKPVIIEMIDATTKEHVETLEVDACMVAACRTRRNSAWRRPASRRRAASSRSTTRCRCSIDRTATSCRTCTASATPMVSRCWP